MKTLTNNNDGLVDFKENLIFEKVKDTAFVSSKQFKTLIFKKYHYVSSSSLYRKVVNYQVKTYGRVLGAKIVPPNKEELRKSHSNKRHRLYSKKMRGSK